MIYVSERHKKPYEKPAKILRNTVQHSAVPNVCTTKDISVIRRNILYKI